MTMPDPRKPITIVLDSPQRISLPLQGSSQMEISCPDLAHLVRAGLTDRVETRLGVPASRESWSRGVIMRL